MTAPPDLLLGLDGGGTKTLLAVADRDGSVLLKRQSDTLDPLAEPAWPERFAQCLAAADPFQSRLAGAVLGMPCHGEVAQVSARQKAIAASLVPTRHEVINDVEAAFDGALAGSPGVLLLAGTGSMAWAGDGRRSMRCGGWGDVFGDEGSAYWIGREALSAASRAIDGRTRHSTFGVELLRHLGIASQDLLAWCYALPARRPAIAAIALTIDTMARAGDDGARALLQRAGDHIADHAAACGAVLDLGWPIPWSFAGSVFRSSTVMARVIERLGVAPTPPRLPPVGGALLRAARGAGWDVTDSWIERLNQALARLTDDDVGSTECLP